MEKYADYQIATPPIFNVTNVEWQLLIFYEDIKRTGKIILSKNKKIDANIELKDGVLSVTLNDGAGYSFKHKFTYDSKHNYQPRYLSNRKNAEIICWDMDKDGIDELLIGINECRFETDEKLIYMKTNYSMACCLRYDEVNGFTLCEGDMFSTNNVFQLNTYVNDIMLPNKDDGLWYELKGNEIKLAKFVL